MASLDPFLRVLSLDNELHENFVSSVNTQWTVGSL